MLEFASLPGGHAMRAPNKRFSLMRGLSIAAGLALIALAAFATATQAQFRTGSDSLSIGAGISVMGGGTTRGDGKTHLQRSKDGTTGIAGSRGGRGGRAGEDILRAPSGSDRHPPHGRRPGLGTIAPVIGIGTVIGTIGPADAAPPPPPPPPRTSAAPPARRGGINIPPNNETRLVPDEVVLEFAGNVPPQSIAQLLSRQGLVQLEAQTFALTNTTYVRVRITNRRSVRAALRRLGNETTLRTGQPNYLYRTLQQAGAEPVGAAPGAGAIIPGPAEATPKATPVVAAAGALPAAGDPAQYALQKLRLSEAHRLATGDKVLIAVIDSGIDEAHPELQGAIADRYDALGEPETPHAHGTAIAGAIVARARLMGAAPAARILAIRAFGAAGDSAEATTFAILKGVEYAAAKNARVINMSFAGPADPALARHLAAAKARGAVLVAASGNFGPKSPPQYPAADSNVIAASATDVHDKLFKASNIGPHIAVAAPGVDILLPAPNNGYQLVSGTSFAAAYVSGVAALVFQRAPALKPDAVRQLLQSTAKDLGPRGRDRQYGAGLVDAYRAIMAVPAGAAAAR
jgi:subtilisin family serine protease